MSTVATFNLSRSHNSSATLMGRDWVKSLAAHGVLLALLVVGVQWKTKHNDAAPIMMELYSSPAVSVPSPQPKLLSQVIETPKPEPKADVKPDIAIKKETPKEIAKPEAKPTPKPKVEVKPEKLIEKKLEPKPDKKVQEKTDALAKTEALAKAASEKETLAADKLREEALRKIMASASGPSTLGEKGTQAGGAGNAIDAGYIGRVRSLIRSKTIFQIPDNMAGNPKAEFIVAVLPDCTVSGVKLKKSSGNPAWDDAAGRAISGIANLPRPSTGACPSSLEISHQPKD